MFFSNNKYSPLHSCSMDTGNTAIMLTEINQNEVDPGLKKLYGQTLAEVTFHKIKDLFQKVFFIVENFSHQSKYEKLFKEDILISKYGKSPLSKALTGFKACRTKYAFLSSVEMPLIQKKAVDLMTPYLSDNYDAVVPRHENGRIEALHSFYKTDSAVQAIQDSIADERFNFENVLLNLNNVKYIPVEKFKQFDPKLNTFTRVRSELELDRAKEHLRQKVFKSRLDKAERLSPDIKMLETGTTVYFKVPGADEEHEVSYNKRKNNWACDCKYYTMKASYCSHILAAQRKLNVSKRFKYH